jgi:hypothetical protein
MVTSLVRIISDRSVGGLFFNSYHLMDYELMGGEARKAIISEMKARGKEPGFAAAGAVRFQAVADADLGRPGPGHARRRQIA